MQAGAQGTWSSGEAESTRIVLVVQKHTGLRHSKPPLLVPPDCCHTQFPETPAGGSRTRRGSTFPGEKNEEF